MTAPDRFQHPPQSRGALLETTYEQFGLFDTLCEALAIGDGTVVECIFEAVVDA